MSVDDRLSFGEGPLGGPPPEEEPQGEPPGDRPNRAFLFIAIAMGGLILLGILALVAALAFWLPRQRQAQVASVTQTVAAMTQEAAAWTPTFAPSPTAVPATPTPTPLPTLTPAPTATATRVVSQETPTRLPTSTPRSTSGGTPTAGLGGFGTAAIAVGLVGLMFAVRKLRSSS
jgi:type II secretory pathway pseudopilin PulG